MLIRLLKQRLRPYRGLLAVVVVLQLIQAIANLYLPSLNADIIDDGVAQGDTGTIWRLGGIMLAITLVQVAGAIGAVWAGARVAMSIGRDLRAETFDHVQTFSARELGTFGAPSLITRTTNDVQQVQMVVYMALTVMIIAPIILVGGVIMALRESLEMSWLILVVVPLLGVLLGFAVVKLRPLFQSMQKRIDGINRVLREQIGGIRVIRAFVRDTHERERFAAANTDLMAVSMKVGRFMSFMFPTVFWIMNASSVAVLWFGAVPGRGGPGHRVADRVPELPHADPHLRDDGRDDVHDGAARGGLRGPHRRGPGHDHLGGPTGRTGGAERRPR